MKQVTRLYRAILGYTCITLLAVLSNSSLMPLAVNGISSTNGAAALYYSTGTTPAPVSGDTFSGYVSFDTGLTIPQGANVTLDTVGIFGEALDFGNQNSTLTLSQDVQCRSDFSITGTAGGKINGGGHTLRLAGDLTISQPITNTGTLVIDGCGNRLMLSADNVLQVSTGKHLKLRNMDLILSTGSPFSGSGSGTLYLENVNMFLGTSIAMGSVWLEYIGVVTINGQGLSFGTGGQNNIDDNSMLYVGQHVTFQPQLSDNIALLGANSTLALDGCTFDMNTYRLNIFLTKGMVTFSNQVLISAKFQTLTIGDGTGANDTKVEINSGANVIVDGTLYHNPA